MNTLMRSQSLADSAIDNVNCVIRSVSVVTAGQARGHDLEVDRTTLEQMLGCARSRGQIPVKIDHKSGAGAVCGFLTNFQIDGKKLKADWFLLESHPLTPQILEVARRMPRGVGLSASFLSPDIDEPGKARCKELISVDYVTLPAANPDGMFGATNHWRPRAIAYRRKHDGRRDLSARVVAIMFEGRPELRRLIDATSRNVEIPTPFQGEIDQTKAVIRYSKKPLVRRITKKLAKVAIGAGLGHLAGRHYGGKAGTIVGAVSGLLFSNQGVRRNIQLSLNYAHCISNL